MLESGSHFIGVAQISFPAAAFDSLCVIHKRSPLPDFSKFADDTTPSFRFIRPFCGGIGKRVIESDRQLGLAEIFAPSFKEFVSQFKIHDIAVCAGKYNIIKFQIVERDNAECYLCERIR